MQPRPAPPPGPPDAPARAPDAWWPHLTVLGWTALVLVAVEVALEARAYRRGWDTLLFGQAALTADDAERDFGPTDAFPFRSRVVSPERTPGTQRLWIASASYALGGNLPVEEIFAERLDARLRGRGVRPEVLNAGRVAFAIPDNVRELAAAGPRWKPDVVVLYQMSTDVDELSRLLLGTTGLSAASGAEGLDWGSQLVDRTTLQPLLKEHVSSRVTLLRPLVDTLGEAGERAFEERVRSFLAAVRALGAQPVLCTFATSHDRASPEALPPHVFRFNLRLSRKGWHDTVDAWNEVLRRVARTEGVPLADVAAVLLGRPEAFVDFVHFSAPGHDAVARVLAETLLASGPPVAPR